MSTPCIEKARFAAGGERGKDIDIARLLGISPAAVSRWGGVVPPNRAIQIEKKSGGKVTRFEIRPDYFGAGPNPDDTVGNGATPPVTREEGGVEERAATFPKTAA